MSLQHLVSRVAGVIALAAAYVFFAPHAVVPNALAASVEDVPVVVTCDLVRCADARTAERYVVAVSLRLLRLASRLTSAGVRNVAAEAATKHARDCADGAGLLVGQRAATLTVMFPAVVAPCRMAAVELRQAYVDARQQDAAASQRAPARRQTVVPQH
jgi:hypothetical protein